MKIIAHRGAIEHHDENTLKSILKSIELPFDGVEFDVRRTADGEIILMHDSTVDRTTNGQGRVSALTLEDIGQLRTHDGQTIPTLSTVMDRLSSTKKIINIEIKSHGCAEAVAGYAARPNVRVSSPISSELKRVGELEPKAILGFVTSNPIRAIISARSKTYQFLTLHRSILNPKVVRLLYKQKKQIWAFPIRSQEGIEKMRRIAVTAVFSDVTP